jgi:hypothetical protein
MKNLHKNEIILVSGGDNKEPIQASDLVATCSCGGNVYPNTKLGVGGAICCSMGYDSFNFTFNLCNEGYNPNNISGCYEERTWVVGCTSGEILSVENKAF